jgi:porphobilinogen synthase
MTPLPVSRVGAIRSALDENGFMHIPIMAYSAKFASAFYGPFREAAESAPQLGDRRSYQMDAPNGDDLGGSSPLRRLPAAG